MELYNKKNKLLELYGITILDIICTVLSFVIALAAWHYTSGRTRSIDQDSAIIVSLLILLFITVYNILMDNNRNFFTRETMDEVRSVAKCILISVLAALVCMFLTMQHKNLSRLILILFAVIAIPLTVVAHNIFKKAVKKYYVKTDASSKVLIITTNKEADSLLQKVANGKNWSHEIIGAVIMDANRIGETIAEIPVIADASCIYDKTKTLPLDEVLIRLPGYEKEEIKQMIMEYESTGATCHFGIDYIELDYSEKTVESFAGIPVVSYTIKYMDFRRAIIKRLIDIVGSVIGLAITAVITPFVALAIVIENPGPVFFSQVRMGKNGRRFKIYKFRSMYTDAEERLKDLESQNEMTGLMFKMENDPRVTKVGKFIRKTSIDELPQFYNILIGQMSLVGTRPPTVKEFEQYNMYYRRRLSMTPGLTGMWQVSGRSDITDFDEIVKLDLEYIDNWTLTLDIKILMKTVTSVLFGKGAK